MSPLYVKKQPGGSPQGNLSCVQLLLQEHTKKKQTFTSTDLHERDAV